MSLRREQYSVIPVIPKPTKAVKTFRICITFSVKYRISITNHILTIILSKIHVFDNFPKSIFAQIIPSEAKVPH